MYVSLPLSLSLYIYIWLAQMCLRLRPQGHENSVAFDVHCIVLEVFCIVLVPFLNCFVASKAPGRMKQLF